MFFYMHQSHRHDSTQSSLFMSWVALCEPLVCSYDISHSRALQTLITSLAASSMAQMVTHPSPNWVQSCLTSVIGPCTVTPCQWADLMVCWLYGFLVNIKSGGRAVVTRRAEFHVLILEFWSYGFFSFQKLFMYFGMNGLGLIFALLVHFLFIE